ncbi:DUF4136 domain-containing protein [Niastella populi]|uniref:DUF4136 domain-containing protein n=1 Tax=Niastella populi TaxID=550983 RepID=A0A1V9F527_9BACT|nr:DUF4136 domain-containing protein [Niastella populi]OQP53509.1 hypothetical protein A4R26_05870 [Niastella populi]
MTKITTVSAVLGLILFIVSCGPSTTQTIGKNVDPDAVNLRDARTYGWISSIDNIPETHIFISPTGVYAFNNESARKRIKDAIEYELKARGYKMYDSGNEPDMEVSFFISEQAGTLRKTGSYVMVQGEPVIPSDNVEEVAVEPGTLIVNIIDGKTDKMVWQGFASGILKPEDVNDELKINQAVSSVFNRFNFKAAGNR